MKIVIVFLVKIHIFFFFFFFREDVSITFNKNINWSFCVICQKIININFCSNYFSTLLKKQVRYFNWSNYFVHSLYYLSLYFTIDNDILLYYYPISQLCHQFYIKATYNEATIYVRMFFLHPLFFFFLLNRT